MCGLAGFLKTDALSTADMEGTLPRMTAALRHRGPDDEGFWCDADAGIALGHRRLAIIDLSPLGHQPMTSPGGRYTIAYNGEMYNYLELRRELAAGGCAFHSESDTEVLLAAADRWGVTGAIERCMGMFAFALWDSRERLLYLARDRFGEKPLYYGLCGDSLLFGSELKALRRHPLWLDEIDRDALALLMQHDFIPAPHCIFRNIRKLAPGSFVSVRATAHRIVLEEHRYWRPELYFDAAEQERPKLSAAEAVEEIAAALAHAIRRQMLADVPVGAFLSGGTDSSLVVAMMQRIAARPVKTFSIGFVEQPFDEAPFARAVAAHLGTEHTEYVVTPRECREVIPELPRIYDEPFADQSQIPTCLLCRRARAEVTVALTGDGGDELFAGYGRYATAISRWRAVSRFPAALRAGGSTILAGLPAGVLAMVARPAGLIWRNYAGNALAERLRDRLPQLRAANVGEFYRDGVCRWHSSSGLVLGASCSADIERDSVRPRYADDLKQLMYADTRQYLPDDVLVKVDRAAMATSLETRVPLLDVDVAHAAWRIPSSVLLKDGRGKWVLRELLRRYVPDSLVNRPKKGFAAPIGQWLRADLRPWAADMLDPHRLQQEGYLEASMIQRRWRQHLAGSANWGTHLWNVLAFEAWLESDAEMRAEPRTRQQTP